MKTNIKLINFGSFKLNWLNVTKNKIETFIPEESRKR